MRPAARAADYNSSSEKIPDRGQRRVQDARRLKIKAAKAVANADATNLGYTKICVSLLHQG